MPRLVLTRLKGETIVIDDEIRITVEQVRGPKVRLEINAPVGVRVDRAEVDRARKTGRPSIECARS